MPDMRKYLEFDIILNFEFGSYVIYLHELTLNKVEPKFILYTNILNKQSAENVYKQILERISMQGLYQMLALRSDNYMKICTYRVKEFDFFERFNIQRA